MPEISLQSIMLALAVVLLAGATIGLAPSTLDLVRRRRLVTQLAQLKVDEDVAKTLFSPVLAATRRREDEAGEEDRPVAPAPEVRQPAQVFPAHAARVAAEPEAALAVGASIVLTGQSPLDHATSEAADEIEAELEPGSREEDEGETGVAPETLGSSDGDDDDDLLSLFRENRVSSNTSTVPNHAIGTVTASDLLDQAREVRELLRRSG